MFKWSGNTTVDPGFTVLQDWHSVDKDSEIMYEFEKDQKWEIAKVGVTVGMSVDTIFENLFTARFIRTFYHTPWLFNRE